jgi:hypothetical protein
MSWHEALVIAHIVGAAIGVGAATATDSAFLRSIRNRRVTSDQFLLVTSVSDVVLLGLAVVTLTGAGLVILSPELIMQPGFQAKLMAVGVLLVNGIGFHQVVIPFLEEHRDVRLDDEALSPARRALLAGSGTLSAVSWYAALVLGAMPAVDWPLIAFLAIYGVLLAGGAAIAFLVLRHVTPELDEEEKLKVEHEQEHQKTRWEILAVLVLLLVFAASVGLAVLRVA